MRHALLTYCRTRNLGDEIQSIAAWNLLPRVDALADRDFLSEFAPAEPTKLIVNGWFCHRPHDFDIRENVRPLFLSFHVNPDPEASHSRKAFSDMIRGSPRLRDLLVRHGPIGARDAATADFLKEVGIPAFLSGCLTLTLERDPSLERGEVIVAADAPPEVHERLRVLTSRPIVKVRHVQGKYITPPRSFATAEKLLRRYQSAHLVVTRRLHVALPCLAFGIPVMLVSDDLVDPRLAGLAALTRHFTCEEFKRLSPAALEQPDENPTSFLSLRQELIERTRAFLGDDLPSAGRQEEDSSASETVARLWRSSGLDGRAQFAWRWLRRARLARRAKVPGLH